MQAICEICSCDKITLKYKCPKCYIRYCSLNCWKIHKEADCSKQNQTTNFEIDKTGDPHMILFPTEDTVDPAHLERLRHDKKLKEILKIHALRDIIEEVDKSTNVKSSIKQAMQEPIFLEFADRCLAIIDPVDNDDLEDS